MTAWPARAQYEYLGKLVAPYVPTNQPAIDAMLRIAGVGPGDYVIDLGSGDGRILITAAKFHGARGFGVELEPRLVRESRENATRAGVADRVNFEQRDLFATPLGRATVVTLYLFREINLKLRPRLLAELRPGTRIVAHDFDMGEWKPDITARVRGTGSEVYLWVVPSHVAGRWRLRIAGPPREETLELEFTQRFQEIDGRASRGADLVHVREARLDGDRVSLVLIDDADPARRRVLEGRMQAGVMEGIAYGEGALRGKARWRATRAAP